MMTVSSELRHTWDDVENEEHDTAGYWYRRLSIGCALPVYAGMLYPGPSRRLSLLVPKGTAESVGKEETRGYAVEVEMSPVSHDGRSFIHITAKGKAFGDVFAFVAGDIVEHWSRHHTAASAISSLQHRLQHWRHFFQRGSKGLSREEYIGLYGELFLLEALLNEGCDREKAVDSWQGSFGANQDFMLGPLAIEVKTSTGNDADTIWISNERQLDSTGLTALYLFHPVFDFRQFVGRTLADLVASLMRTLVPSPSALAAFEDRLHIAGYAPETPCQYQDFGFTARLVETYEVREGFPRVTENDLPSGVVDISYHLQLAGCTSFKCELGPVLQGSLHGE